MDTEENLRFKYRPSLYISIRNHWDKDYKPLAYPKTKAEREAAAAKYGLSISEYQVYPDDGAGLGDYPQVSTVSAAQRDAFYPWDYPELRRNYGEPFHRDFDLICEERYDLNAKHRTPGWLQWMQFILVLELEHKIFIIQCYYRTGQKLENGEWVYSINRCIEEFQQQFPNLPVTYAQLLKQIQACVIKFGEIGAVTRKPGGGAPKKRTANLIEDVQQRMEHSPKKSVATLSQQVGLSVGTCHTILKKDLKLFPYKIQAVSELKEIDFGVMWPPQSPDINREAIGRTVPTQNNSSRQYSNMSNIL
ncbi:nadh-ubiquinone oxidoreductase ashi subunit [Holotrichia oblita]|uniref:Nadh-ubiquinone oxidoreductase ashi subunit n=1 Tax=Holotrichia oblita TaxID=644536 RepID=A0ACB9TVB4_HOLOL|nr:nadh-ubiquinone oxidoreductase ashi subunit [Holotrichia oblita]